MATHSSILAWRIQWTEEPDRVYSPWPLKELDMTKRLTHSPFKATKAPHPYRVFPPHPKPPELTSLLQPLDSEPLFPAVWFCHSSLFEIWPHAILLLMLLLVYYIWAML